MKFKMPKFSSEAHRNIRMAALVALACIVYRHDPKLSGLLLEVLSGLLI